MMYLEVILEEGRLSSVIVVCTRLATVSPLKATF